MNDEVTKLNSEQMDGLFENLRTSVKDAVDHFNEHERRRHPELPKAEFERKGDLFQVYKPSGLNVFNSPRPSNKFLNCTHHPYFAQIEMRVDGVLKGSYRFGRDNGKPIFIDADDTRLTAEQLVQEIVVPFLSDKA